MRAFSRISSIAFLLFVSSAASSATIEWSVDATFDDGSTLVGSFLYDEDTNEAFWAGVTIEGGDTPGLYYGEFDFFGFESQPGYQVLHLEALEHGRPGVPQGQLLDMRWDLTTLTGQTHAVLTELTHTQLNGDNPPLTIRSLSSGSISAISEVPIPAALWLFGSALAGLGWVRRKPTV